MFGLIWAFSSQTLTRPTCHSGGGGSVEIETLRGGRDSGL